MRIMVSFIIGLLLTVSSCEQTGKEVSSIDPINWDKRKTSKNLSDSTFIHGSSYLSVYSQIYERSQKLTYDLTATVSIRNISSSDTVYIKSADYFGTDGNLIRQYIKNTVFVAPMETVEIVIDEVDKSGGTGANFIFDWAIHSESNEPLFEAVMISTRQQGVSFTSKGVRR